MKPAAAFLSAALLALSPALASGAEKALSDAQAKRFAGAVVRWLAAKHGPSPEEKRARILEELAEFEAISWKGLRKALQSPAARPFLAPWKRKSGATLRYPPPGLESCTFEMGIPSGAPPARGFPLAVLLHGGGRGEGHGSQILGLLGPSFQKRGCLLVAPTAPPNAIWSDPISEAFVTAILAEVSATYSVDFDRIYVAGHSFGGVGAWSFGTRFPDLFAGFGPAAGNPPNVMDYELFYNTAFYVVHGTNDVRVTPDRDLEAQKAVEALQPKPRAYVFDFFKAGDDIGHEFPQAKMEAMAEFLTSKKRDLFAPRVVCVSPFAQMNNPAEADTLSEYRTFWLGTDEKVFKGKAVGEIAGDNRLKVRLDGLGRVFVYVSDEFLDLDRPVVVEVDGRVVFEKKVERSVKFLLEHIEKTGDRGRAFANRIRLP